MSNSKLTPEEIMAQKTRRSFLALGAGAAAAIAGWEWLDHQPEEYSTLAPLRKVFAANEGVVRNVLYSNSHLAPVFPKSAITEQKENGADGLDDDLDDTWRLEVVPRGSDDPSHTLTVDAVKALPKYEQIIEFKCVEGWSAISHFAGARFSDFTAKFAPGSENAAYAGLLTPDAEYYVGLDMPSALHPQTLLAYEMNGQPLTEGHGAPLRLVIPVKYGIKNIKRIGRIEYTDTRPDDFWHERGYDYYSGL